jgi:hypothetical protein
MWSMPLGRSEETARSVSNLYGLRLVVLSSATSVTPRGVLDETVGPATDSPFHPFLNASVLSLPSSSRDSEELITSSEFDVWCKVAVGGW